MSKRSAQGRAATRRGVDAALPRPGPPVSGVVVIDKPAGITSHDVVQRVRRSIGQRQVGHTGTLDPMATGVMVVTLGRATRIGRYLEAADKDYEGTVLFGRSTTTFDADGTVVEEAEVPPLSERDLERCLSTFVGEVEQEVPAYSAVKVDGERLHRRARRGQTVAPPRRQVTIHAVELERWVSPALDFRVRVSKGTYIRSLAVQIGAFCGVPAHLSRLVRTRVGRFTHAEAVAPEDGPAIRAAVRSMADALADYPAVRVDARAAEDVRHGRPLTAGQVQGRWADEAVCPHDPVRILDASGALLAVARLEASPVRLGGGPASARALRYDCVLAVNPSG